MKIFALLNNYRCESIGKHPLSIGSELTWYEMADSSLLRSGNPFFIPDFDDNFRAYASVVYRIGRLGKSISPRFAERYIDGVGVAVAIVARNVLERLRSEGLPWTQAVSFDRSCLIGNLQPIDTLINNEEFVIRHDDVLKEYSIRRLIRPIEEIISIISRDNTLKNGDLILAGLEPDGFSLTADRNLVVEQKNLNIKLLDIKIK